MSFFELLAYIEDIYWTYIGFSIIVLLGLALTIKTKGFQFVTLVQPRRYIGELLKESSQERPGIHPIRLYFASIGGMVGLGNIATVITAVTIGGPGSIFWLWVASFAGMLIKYAEIYLGIQHRIPNKHGGYDGGPMYYLQHAFSTRIVGFLFCILMCIYGAEISQFQMLSDTLSETFSINRNLIIGLLLVLVLYCSLGGVSRLANTCSTLMPPFMVLYIIMCFWVIGAHWESFASYLPVIFSSAFEGHAPLGGFAGSTMLAAIHYGTSKAVYSGDIGIGYDSIIQSETQVVKPEKQARVAVYALASDTLICTLSCLVVLVTGVWTEQMQPSFYVMTAMEPHFPFIHIFLAVLFFLAAFTTIIGYLVIGLKCARFMHKQWGEKIYLAYAVFAFIFFSFFDQTQVIIIMSISGGMLMLINIMGILKLWKEIKFH